VRAEDVEALVALTRETEIDCRGVVEPGPSCPEDALGTVRHGVPMGPWASEYSLASEDEYRRLLLNFFAQSRRLERDAYGDGGPRLFDMRCYNPDAKELEAIVTSIGPEGRVALLFRSEYRQSSWGIVALVVVRAPFVEDALAPGPSCYDLE